MCIRDSNNPDTVMLKCVFVISYDGRHPNVCLLYTSTSSDTDDIEHTKSTSDSSDVIANVRASMDDDLTPRQEEMRQRLMDDDGDHEVRVADSDVRPLVYRDIDTDETEADLTEEETIDITEGLPAGTQEVTVEAQPEPFILSLTINGEVYQYKIDASAILDTLRCV